MRRKLLSIVMIFAVLVVAVAVHRGITRMDGDGKAQAALGAISAPVGEMRAAVPKNLAREISLQPAKLLKVRGQDVKTILREPELIRHEAPTTIWQYRTASCVLDIYFTGKADALLSPVAHYEIRAREKNGNTAEMQKTCVKELARKSGRPRMVDVSALYKH